jgi:predicted metal-binding membrane protein
MWPRVLLEVARRGPAKVLLLASAAGWISMAWLAGGDQLAHPASHSPGHFAAIWLAMLLAMAPLLLVREIGRLWRAGLRRLRVLTIAWFVCGYVGVWMFAGVALSALSGWVTLSIERIAVAATLIVLWHCSPVRQRCLNACHRVPSLRVFGAAAQLDALRYGGTTGCYCAATCGVVMLLALLVKEHHLIVMGVAAVVTTLERHLPARRPRWQLPVLRGRSLDWPDMTVA